MQTRRATGVPNPRVFVFFKIEPVQSLSKQNQFENGTHPRLAFPKRIPPNFERHLHDPQETKPPRLTREVADAQFAPTREYAAWERGHT